LRDLTDRHPGLSPNDADVAFAVELVEVWPLRRGDFDRVVNVSRWSRHEVQHTLVRPIRLIPGFALNLRCETVHLGGDGLFERDCASIAVVLPGDVDLLDEGDGRAGNEDRNTDLGGDE
jgi:hypothetical protein